MKLMPRVPALIIGLAIGSGPLAAQPKNGVEWTPMQMMQFKRISGVQVSPDGKRVVYTVKQAVMDDGKSGYLSHIYVVNASGTFTIQLTGGDKSCDDPQWSPDGKQIAYLSKKIGKRNLWIISPEGKAMAQLTDMKTDVTSFKWSPDSKRIAFTAKDAPTPEEEKAKKDKNDTRVVDENFKMSRLYVVPAATAAKTIGRVLTTGNYNVPATGRAGYDWSPDSKTIVFTHTKAPLADDWPSADISFVEVESQKVRPFMATGAAEFSPFYSPDGKWIAFASSDSPPKWASSARVYVATPGGERARALAPTHDEFGRYSEIIGWSADGQGVLFTEMRGTYLQVSRLPIDKSPDKFPLPGGVYHYGVATGGINLNATRTHFGFSWETMNKPAEACISKSIALEPKPVSIVNHELRKLPLAKTEVIRWKSKDGLEIEGLLTYPANYKEGQRYPLLLNVHGGPMGVFTQTFVASPGLYPIATFSGRGYAVLRPNPRGSSGYGKKFRYANYGDWGGGDYHDLMTGVDHVVKLGVADENRLGVMGWSYGGFMTSWIITQNQRFKAASVGAGVTNLMSFTGTADIPSFLPDYFGGEFWDKFDAYKNHSAMFHVKRVKTPTLIQHGEKDERVPLSQGLELYNALKRQNCTTKMVIYPRTPHGIEEPRLLVDCMERNLEWFDKYLR